jgi:hypothetical protein
METGEIIGASAGALGTAGAAAMGFWAMGQAKDQNDKILAFQTSISNQEANRTPIINPYANTKNLAGMLSNKYENLGVATKAAEFQAQQTDVALANTLDTLRTSGASAGGATALAMAALKSKQGISASIEQQEAQNEKLRAQGAMQLQQMQLAENQRIQQADVAGRQFMYAEQDKRDMQKLDRTQAELDQVRQYQTDMQTQGMTAFGTGVGMLGDIGGAALSNPG